MSYARKRALLPKIVVTKRFSRAGKTQAELLCLTLQAFAQLWTLPEVLSLQQPGQGDKQPDVSEAILKLSAAWVRHSSILQPSSSQLTAVLPSTIAATAACARCCHKKVGSCALAVLLALLSTAAEGCATQQHFQEVVAGHAMLIAYGALGALLVPSPLPRLQKVSSVLLELAALAALVEQPGHATTHAATQQQAHAAFENGIAPAANSALGSQLPLQQPNGCVSNTATTTAPQGVLHGWLLQAMQGFVPAPLTAHEAADFAAACAGLLVTTPSAHVPGVDGGCVGTRQLPASRSYVAARRLKKRLRDFAEKHMRACSTQPG